MTHLLNVSKVYILYYISNIKLFFIPIACRSLFRVTYTLYKIDSLITNITFVHKLFLIMYDFRLHRMEATIFNYVGNISIASLFYFLLIIIIITHTYFILNIYFVTELYCYI